MASCLCERTLPALSPFCKFCNSVEAPLILLRVRAPLREIFQNEKSPRFSAYRRALVFAGECGARDLALRWNAGMDEGVGFVAFAGEHGSLRFRNHSKAPPATHSPPRGSGSRFSAFSRMLHDLECQASIHRRRTGFC